MDVTAKFKVTPQDIEDTCMGIYANMTNEDWLTLQVLDYIYDLKETLANSINNVNGLEGADERSSYN